MVLRFVPILASAVLALGVGLSCSAPVEAGNKGAAIAGGVSEEDIKVWETAVIMRLGATYGVLQAEGNTRPEKFCASAKQLKADPDVPNVCNNVVMWL